MAYKFQAGQSNLSGALEQQGDAVLKGAVTVADALTPEAADGAALGSATLEWSDLYLADASVINMGADQDVTITHVADAGVLLNSSRQFQFGDSGTYINQPANARLKASSDGTFEIDAATTVKIDSDAGDISFEDGGVAQLAIDMDGTAGEIIIQQKVAGDDLVFKAEGGDEVLRLTSENDVEVKDDLLLKSDAAVLNFGADSDVSLTHVADTGLLLNSSRQLQFGDSATYIAQQADGLLSINGEADIALNASAEVTVANDLTLQSDAGILGFGANAGSPDTTITHVTDTGLLLNSSRQLQFGDSATHIKQISDSNLEIEADGSIILDSPVIDFQDDAVILKFGDASDVSLTHVADTGLLLNGAMQLQFRDATEYINSDADGSMNIRAATDVALNINGTDELLINATTATFGTNIAFAADGKTLGSATNADLLTLAAAAVTVKSNSDFNVAKAGGFQLAGTAMTADADELSLMDAGVAIAAEVALIDADGIIVEDGNVMKKVAMSSIKSYIGGGSVAVTSGSAGFTASVGINYFNDIAGAIECRLPITGGLAVGESIIFKAGSDCSTSNTILIIPADADSVTIDGANDVVLESPYAGLELVYTVSGDFRIL